VTGAGTNKHGAVLEKPIVTQLVKKFFAFYGTRRIITAFTRITSLSPEPGECSPCETWSIHSDGDSKSQLEAIPHRHILYL